MKHTNIFKFATAILAMSILLLSVTACSSDTASADNSSNTEVTALDKANPYKLDTTDLVKPELDLSNPEGVLKDILDTGVLKVATSPDYPCSEWIDGDGNVYGYEMMIGKYIASCLGVEFEIETSDFSGTFVAVDTGKAHMAISGYGWKKDRAENYEISVGWISDPDSAEAKHTLIVAAGTEDQYNSLEDFVGKKIMAQANSLQEMYVTDEILTLDPDNTTTLEPVATLDQAILGLASAKCDAVALDNTTAENYVASSEGSFALTEVYFDLTPYGDYQGTVALAKKGETQFIDIVNQCLNTAAQNGYITTWYTDAKAAAGLSE